VKTKNKTTTKIKHDKLIMLKQNQVWTILEETSDLLVLPGILVLQVFGVGFVYIVHQKPKGTIQSYQKEGVASTKDFVVFRQTDM
jgi:hypothetical protein